MGTKANPTVIGAFIIGAVGLMIAAVLVLSGGQWFTEKNRFVLYFEGSVNGLNVGAPVKFRGVEVGAVTGVRALYNPKDYTAWIQVEAEVEPGRFSEVLDDGAIAPASSSTPDEVNRLIEQGLRAQLEVQSMVTGLLFIELDFHPQTPVKLVGLKSDYPEVPTIPTTMEALFGTARQALEELGKLPLQALLSELLAMIERVNVLLMSPEMEDALQTVGSILHGADEGLADTLVRLAQLMETVDGTADGATAALEAGRTALVDVRQFVQHVNGQVSPLAGGVQKTLGTARGTLNQARKTIRTLEGAASPALGQAEKVMAAAADLTGSNSVVLNDLSHTLAALKEAARSIRILADYLQRNPESLLRGKGRAGGQ